eukprot:CAMPEP_0197324814 /NCGR_PEP_ID=MMETSP0891-20130614/71320_1 /TAXON_ID=44058 ORGANISM="Aureoumbra lagunensis, Strain CCMP1510" /NCGR_SAMPLE_ID=MMETSP0891 /ASSEMBLY_ACC=CAM_ASM_000534 /LENGTH=1144 /DNA_ID=CAMNT_0042817683 /DNA_START=114 /DNA_END=3549 /DNA_ORIENTATION=-
MEAQENEVNIPKSTIIEEDDDGFCGVCGSAHSEEGDALLYCDGTACKVAIHQLCYGVTVLPPENEKWLCEPCIARTEIELKKAEQTQNKQVISSSQCQKSIDEEDTGESQIQQDEIVPVDIKTSKNEIIFEEEGQSALPSVCMICKMKGHEALAWKRATLLGRDDALNFKFDRGTDLNGWVHTACALWVPGASFLNDEKMDIAIIGDLNPQRANLKCSLCGISGHCIQCSGKRCAAAFHPICIITELLGPREWSQDPINRWRRGVSKGIGHVLCYRHCRWHKKKESNLDEDNDSQVVIQKSEYELEREARIAQNALFLASLGLGNNSENINKKTSSRKKSSNNAPPTSVGTRRSPRERKSTVTYVDPSISIGFRTKEEIQNEKAQAEARKHKKRLIYAEKCAAAAAADDAKYLLRRLLADRLDAAQAIALARAAARDAERKIEEQRKWEIYEANRVIETAKRDLLAAARQAEKEKLAAEREAKKRRMAAEKEAAKLQKELEKDQRDAARAVKGALEEEERRQAATLREAMSKARDRYKRIHNSERRGKKPDLIASDAKIAELLLVSKYQQQLRLKGLRTLNMASLREAPNDDTHNLSTMETRPKKKHRTRTCSSKQQKTTKEDYVDEAIPEPVFPTSAEEIANTIEAEASHLPPCCFCGSSDDNFDSASGAFIPNIFLRPASSAKPQGTLIRSHTRCANLAPNVYTDQHDVYYNVLPAASRAHKQRCKGCGRLGANIQCLASDCKNFYHVPCAVSTLWAFGADKSFYCPEHRTDDNLECCVDRLGERWVSKSNRSAWELTQTETCDDEARPTQVPRNILGLATGVHCPKCLKYDPRNDEDYVGCDYCRSWWHPSCAGIIKPRAQARLNKLETWMCPDCEQKQRTLEEETVCICGVRSVDSINVPMLLCENCEIWHHPACVNVSNTDFAKFSASTDPWFCPTCAVKPRVCLCHRPRNANAQFITCETCNNDYHPACVGLEPDEAQRYAKAKDRGDTTVLPYICPTCYANVKEERSRKIKNTKRRKMLGSETLSQQDSTTNGENVRNRQVQEASLQNSSKPATDELPRKRYKPAARRSKKPAATTTIITTTSAPPQEQQHPFFNNSGPMASVYSSSRTIPNIDLSQPIYSGDIHMELIVLIISREV